MFSNGTEYEWFQRKNCERCYKFIYWEDADDENQVCIIEEDIAMCGAGTDEGFPYEYLIENDHIWRYDCKEFKEKV